MTKERVTIRLDRAKATAARDLVDTGSTSEVVDIDLDRLVRSERLRRDVEAYRRLPPTPDEQALADLGDTSKLYDDTDWEALYAAGA